VPESEPVSPCTLAQLLPGDLVRNGPMEAVFVGALHEHPLYPGLWLAIWRMPDDSVSLDALDPNQHVGLRPLDTHRQRHNRLRQALLGGHS
jgi:hypothetical protein